MTDRRLGIGFIGSGFNARFHMLGFQAVRDAEVRGVWSPNAARAGEAAAYARRLDVGDAKPYPSIAGMVADPAIDALWLCGPNQARIDNVEEIVHAVTSGKGELKGLACEKPLARNVAEAEQVVGLVKKAKLRHGYLENQRFAPQIETGKNLGAPASSVKPVRITGHIASLKWSRPEYVKKLADAMGKEVDYAKTPAEDFASVMIEFQSADGHKVLGEATTSWSFVGAGLRLSAELLGPEYSMSWNTLDSGLKLFFSREVRGKSGEDLVEKQNAEIGQMPVVANEAAAYGYEAEDRHFVRVFLGKEEPLLTFDDGLEVVQMLMTAYRSAEEGRTVDFSPKEIASFIPAVAKGTWKP